MRNDERFEIERAIDLLPHVVGSSWAMTYFRLKKLETLQNKNSEKKQLNI